MFLSYCLGLINFSELPATSTLNLSQNSLMAGPHQFNENRLHEANEASDQAYTATAKGYLRVDYRSSEERALACCTFHPQRFTKKYALVSPRHLKHYKFESAERLKEHEDELRAEDPYEVVENMNRKQNCRSLSQSVSDFSLSLEKSDIRD